MSQEPTVMGAEAAIGPARYSPQVWQRFRSPAHAGKPAHAISACVEARAHQLQLCLHARPSARGIEAAGFTATGCPTTIAVADYCAERLVAAPAAEIDAQAIIAALEIPEHRRHCVMLCEDALHELLRALDVS